MLIGTNTRSYRIQLIELYPHSIQNAGRSYPSSAMTLTTSASFVAGKDFFAEPLFSHLLPHQQAKKQHCPSSRHSRRLDATSWHKTGCREPRRTTREANLRNDNDLRQVRETLAEDAGVRAMQIGENADLARLDALLAAPPEITGAGAAGTDPPAHSRAPSRSLC